MLSVGLANQLLTVGPGGAAGVEWSQAGSVLLALLVSLVIGLLGTGVLLLSMKRIVRNRALYEEPQAGAAEAAVIRPPSSPSAEVPRPHR